MKKKEFFWAGLKVVTIEIIEIVTTIIVTTFKRCNNLNPNNVTTFKRCNN